MAGCGPIPVGRLKSVAIVVLAFLLAACREDTTEHPGKKTYERYCFSCHSAGIAGAPKFRDREAWAPRVIIGSEALLQSTVQGIPPGMPRMGLCYSCSEEKLAHAIDYMVKVPLADD